MQFTTPTARARLYNSYASRRRRFPNTPPPRAAGPSVSDCMKKRSKVGVTTNLTNCINVRRTWPGVPGTYLTGLFPATCAWARGGLMLSKLLIAINQINDTFS